MPSLIEVDLVDEQKFTQLFAKYRLVVYKQAFFMTRSDWHAEEIVQEVFLRVWVHRQKLSEIKNLKPWFTVITKRIVFDYALKLSRERRVFSTYKRPDSYSQADDALLPVKCCRLLAEAEKKLSPRQKEVYYLKQVKGLHQKEIARILNIAEFTALHHIRSSISAVRKYVMVKLETGMRKRA